MTATTPRPPLREVPLRDVLPLRPRLAYATCAPGQWDELLAAAYRVGFVLLELDDDEQPVRAYRQRAVEDN